jgi:Holliday junction resolvase RusA-like endonuclease
MTPVVCVTIPGRVGGKGRHRSFVRNGQVLHVTPEKTMSQEALVRSFAALEMRKAKLQVMTGPVAVGIIAFLRTPKSWSKKRRAQARWATGKPDLDNIAKLFLDATQGIVMANDTQVAFLSVQRFYDNEQPEHVVATFRALEAA